MKLMSDHPVYEVDLKLLLCTPGFASILLCRRSVGSLLLDPADSQQQLLWAQGWLVQTDLLQQGGYLLLLLLLNRRGVKTSKLLCWGCLDKFKGKNKTSKTQYSWKKRQPNKWFYRFSSVNKEWGSFVYATPLLNKLYLVNKCYCYCY